MFWVELHCDSGKFPIDNCGRIACWSKSGNSPGITVSQKSFILGKTNQLVERAKEQGWIQSFVMGEWICPVCAALKD